MFRNFPTTTKENDKMKKSPKRPNNKKMSELLQEEVNKQYRRYLQLHDVTRIGYGCRSVYPPTRIPSPEYPLGQSYFFSPDEEE